jgi:hypothetical protein
MSTSTIWSRMYAVIQECLAFDEIAVLLAD